MIKWQISKKCFISCLLKIMFVFGDTQTSCVLFYVIHTTEFDG